MKIDFDMKDTELGWFNRYDKFFLQFVPNWFNWLGWLLILGALQYILELSKNRIISIIYFLTLWFLFRYFYAFFGGIEFAGKYINNHKITKCTMELLLPAITSITFWYLSVHIAQMVKTTTK